MKLPVASLFSQELVQNLCWTLIHSLWQGLVLAILAGLVVQFTRTSTPVLRYNLLTGLFVLFLVCSGVTFWLGFGPKG
ncbi:MAG: hypothetical protein ACO1OQ_04760, partial [Rufibacter sp.]